MARIAAVFSWSCGAIIELGICLYAGKSQSELGLLRTLMNIFRPGDVLLADRRMCAWTEMVMLKQRGIDCVCHCTSHRKADFRRGKRLGKDNYIVRWAKPRKPRAAQWLGQDGAVLQALSKPAVRMTIVSGYTVRMPLRILLLMTLSVLLLNGCRRSAKVSNVLEFQDGVRVQPLAEPQSKGGTLFRKRTSEETGINLVHRFPANASTDMLSDQSSGAGVCIGDIDGDGLPDVYVTNYDQGNRLYRNLGGFRFEDVTQEAGVVGDGRWCAGPSFVDIDNDGDLDLHVCVYAAANLLYINDGKGKFTEQANQFGLAINAASVMMSFADYDLDGDLDGYLVTNRLVTDGKKHELPKNSKAVLNSGVVQMNQRRSIRVAPEYQDLFAIMSKGQRGRLELVIAGQEDILLRNERGIFRSVNREAGITGHGIGLAATWWDYNGDNWPDLYVSNDYKGADQLYRNNGDGTFTDVIEEICPHVPWYSMGADVGDINNDGWIDLFASDMSGTSHYRQKVSMGDMSDDAWFLDLARPPQYMRNAMFVNAGGGRMLEAANMAGISSTDWTWSPKFGDLDNVMPNKLITVTEPTHTPAGVSPSRELPPWFIRTDAFLQFQHRERPFDDYAAQPLLPAKQSQLGPGIACGNVDADGVDDFYLGGAAGSAGSLVLSGANHEMTPRAIAADSECEDMGALFFDADSDGDLDLYVVSGGVEAEPGSPLLQDRLYVQTNGVFAKSDDSLPSIAESGSCVCAADYDRDGDLDLFIGGHVVPGNYPESSPSRLLRNDGGKFVDVTEQNAPELMETRLVNGALWSDANGDGMIDLIVAQEWGTIDIYLNRGGRLEKSSDSGLSGLSGWWSGVVGGDIDEDGDIDYVVTNVGLNTKYHADAEHPVRLFRGDFDGTGNPRLVEAKYERGILFPERGKSCSTAAIPLLSKRFATYRAFAVAGLEEVYTRKSLDDALSLSATTLESGVLINDGSAHFEFKPLPRLAQISPSNGAVLTHLDGDGHLDLVLAQNDFSPQRETGRMDGGVSLVLRGDGAGGFIECWPHESNVSIGGDAQCVLATDLNRDHRPDLVFGVNNQPWHSFVSVTQGELLAVRLAGAVGNPTAVGARVEVLLSSGQTLVQETYAGAGYLTQGGGELFFGLGQSTVKTIRVQWPDGVESMSDAIADHVVIEHPRR